MKRKKTFVMGLTALLALGLTLAAACSDDDSNPGQECGNDIREGSEECDGTDLGGQTCSDVGDFTGGTLACHSYCTFDTSGCTQADNCGNGTIDAGEECDGSDLGGNDCTDVGNYTGGTLDCNADCTFDTAACEVPDDCGNGVIDTGESCDGTDLGGNDCTDVGDFTGGTLQCADDCTFDTAMCTSGEDPSALIAAARSTADGTGLDLPIEGAWVTYVREEYGYEYAGFFIQADQAGPALFVGIDPATLAPVPQVGDEVSFTIIAMATYNGLRFAEAITDFSVDSSGNDVSTLVQDVNSANDLVSALDDYEAELITVEVTLVEDMDFAGSEHISGQIETSAITGDASLYFRMPEVLNETLGLVDTCQFQVMGTPMYRFYDDAQVHAWSVDDVSIISCPAPQVLDAVATDSTTVVVTFDRAIEETTLQSDGSQFTIAGLSVTGAVANGTEVTLTTAAQTEGAAYTVTVASSLEDIAGAGIDANNNSADFTGYADPAVVMINELNADISGNCDLMELRVVSGGSMDGYELWERTGDIYVFSGLMVNTNDFIIVHLDNADCNPDGASDETSAVDEQPQATYSTNYDTAWDLYSSDSGLTRTDNVFTLYDNTGTIMDAVFAADDTSGTAAGGTESQAEVVANAGEWEMSGGGVPAGGFVDDDFCAHAAQDLDGTGDSPSGESIQRNGDTDTNTVDDWTQAASSWGGLNTGQSDF
jgi:hypothetical protein